MDCETDGHGLVVAVAMHYRESVINWPFATALSTSHAPYLPWYLDLIDTTSFTNSFDSSWSVFPDTWLKLGTMRHFI